MGKRAIKTFVIGKDFSEAEVELLVMKLAKWFASDKCDRRSDDPEKDAKEIVHQCLNALTKAGEPWKNAPEEFSNRIKIKAAYNMETGEGIAIQANKSPDAVRKLEQGMEQNSGKLGDMSASLAGFDLNAFREEQETKIIEAYPDLDNPAMIPHVRRLSLLYAQQEMIDRDLLITTNATKRQQLLATIETLNKTLDSVLKILDIHPESIRKKIKESSDGSLGDLVAELDKDDFRAREKLWSLQTALQLWASTVRRNGRGDAPQRTVWEVWHMTRTAPFAFTCKCGRHYPQLIAGFTPKQLKQFLKDNGILIERPVLPTLIDEKSLQGLEQYIDELPEVLEPVVPINVEE
jgi:hypothetical protein